MKPSEFKAWRKDCKLTQEQAAKKLGLKKRTIQYYEKGKRDGKEFKIPKTTELACYAVSGVHADSIVYKYITIFYERSRVYCPPDILSVAS